MNMKTWTISQRISVGLAALVALTMLIGTFAYLRMSDMTRYIEQLADMSIPSTIALNAVGQSARQQAIYLERLADASGAERATLEEAFAKEGKTADDLIKKYESSMVMDGEDRRLFEIVRARLLEVEAAQKQSIAEGREVAGGDPSDPVAAVARESRLRAIQSQLRLAEDKLRQAIDDCAGYNIQYGQSQGELGALHSMKRDRRRRQATELDLAQRHLDHKQPPNECMGAFQS
jgi:hypothetical protein